MKSIYHLLGPLDFNAFEWILLISHHLYHNLLAATARSSALAYQIDHFYFFHEVTINCCTSAAFSTRTTVSISPQLVT